MLFIINKVKIKKKHYRGNMFVIYANKLFKMEYFELNNYELIRYV